MIPSQLTAEHFASYPPQGRKVAEEHVALFRELPLGFAPFLLKELITYDWKFPAERDDLDRQLSYLEGLTLQNRQQELSAFARLQLAPSIENLDWVNSPGPFLEQLSAHLWATHQMDSFRSASESFIRKFNAATPREPLPLPRLGIGVIGKDVVENQYPLFRKLRREGVYFKHVDPHNGFAAILDTLQKRAGAHPLPFAHWYIDGGNQTSLSHPVVTGVSYQSLTPVRVALQEKMLKVYESPSFGAEALRSMLARMTPADLGMRGGDVLDRFQLSLLTEGSGTQIYSTTFVQWAAREAFRRAQPLTLLARFTPRERERPMNELLTESRRTSQPDPMGSLVDADMGAYYTWINQQRLPGAERSSFLVWFEDHSEAVAIAPSLPRGKVDDTPTDLPALLHKIAPLSV